LYHKFLLIVSALGWGVARHFVRGVLLLVDDVGMRGAGRRNVSFRVRRILIIRDPLFLVLSMMIGVDIKQSESK